MGTAKLNKEEIASIGRLMGVVRKQAYLGKEPRGYSPARDVTILRAWLRRGRSEAEIQGAIEGLRKAVEKGTVAWKNPETGQTLRPGIAFTLRALRNTKAGDRWTWDTALDEAFRSQGPMIQSLKDALRDILT